MKRINYLRILVVFNWVLFLSRIAFDMWFEGGQAAEFGECSKVLSSNKPSLTLIIATLLNQVVALVSGIGLLLIQRWARWTFLFSLLVGFVTTIFWGPFVSSGPVVALDYLAALCGGGILTLSFVAESFRKVTV